MKLTPQKVFRFVAIFITVLVVFTPIVLIFSYRPIRVRILAKMGNVNAMLQMGDAYSTTGGNGLLVRADGAKADYWLDRAANQGSVAAMWGLFNAHREAGDYYVKKWLPKAAELGHIPSMIEMSKAYQFGIYGFPRNPTLANEWNQKTKKALHDRKPW